MKLVKVFPMRVRAICMGACVLCVGSARAQDPAAGEKVRATPHGSVVGDVYEAGSHLPVRFALVQLVPKPQEPEPSAGINGAAGGGTVSQPQETLQAVAGSTGMDGSFRLEGVPAGEYLVAAVQAGYVLAFQAKLADQGLTEEQLRALADAVPEVHVTVGQVASVHLTVHRGAAISGRVQFADGSPMIGGSVGCDPAMEPEFSRERGSPLREALLSLSSLRGPRPQAMTDDEGRYRIFGLAAGKYVVSSAIGLDHTSGHVSYSGGGGAQTSGREHMYPELIPVFQPGVFRRRDAKVFEIKGDEHITGADLTIDPEGLHTVRGRVLATSDRHVPSAGMVRLKEVGTKDPGRFVEIEDDGSFQMNYVPSGSYRMEVMASDRVSSAEGPEQVHQYATVVLPVEVRERDALIDDVLLSPLKPGERFEEPPF